MTFMSSHAGQRVPISRRGFIDNAALAAASLALGSSSNGLPSSRAQGSIPRKSNRQSLGVLLPESLTTGALYTNAFVPTGSAYVPPQQT
jgi:hypothetical protein